VDREGAGDVGPGDVEQSLVEHVARAVMAFLTGLEHEDDLAGELAATLLQDARCADQHRRVRVVTAGVHRVVDGRRVVESGVLGHRQRVHVAAQDDRRTGTARVEDGGDAGERVAGRDVQSEPVDGLEHRLLRDGEVQAELGVAMDPSPQRDRIVELAASVIEQAVSGRHASTLRPSRPRPVPTLPNHRRRSVHTMRGSSSTELWQLDACGQRDLVARGKTSGRELVESARGRIARVDPQLGCVVGALFDGERTGIPTLLKDAGQEIEGERLGFGVRALVDHEYRSLRTTPFAARLASLGLAVIGKAACSPMATDVTTEPPGLPSCRNPWDLARTAGGSSGGSAAAVAAGLVPLAHGADHTGSLRFPSSACGCVTLKATRGRVTSTVMGGLTEPTGSYTDGVIARSVRDIAWVLGIAAPHVRSLRVGLATRDPLVPLPVDPACAAAVRQAGRLIETLGHHVADVELPEASVLASHGDDFDLVIAHYRCAQVRWLVGTLGRRLRAGDLPDALVDEAERGAAVSHDAARAAASRIVRALGPLVARWRDLDVVVTPTMRQPAWPLGTSGGLASVGGFCAPFSLTGQPAASIPLHHDDDRNLPVGVQLVGRLGEDETVLGLAAQLEEVAPWRDRWPTIALS
jgi:amidase